MDNQKLIEFLATEVMGWEREEQFLGCPYWRMNDNNYIFVNVFRPTENIQDAWMLVEPLKENAIICIENNRKFPVTWNVTIISDEACARHESTNAARAISLAVAKAAGWKESEDAQP